MRCVHPGETYKTAAGGSVHVFPYDASKSMYEERTSSNCLEDAAIATESRKTFKGIKGPSFLMTLKSYDYVKSSSIDYMHGVLLGIGKLLIKLWVGSSHRPLWVYSCFPFENINGVLMELFDGTQNIEFQMMYSINVVQSMSLMVKGINDQNLIHFADKNNSAKAIIGTSAASFPIGASSNITLSDNLFGKLVNEVKFVPVKILSYKRMSLRGNTLHSTAYTRVQMRNTYTVKYYDFGSKTVQLGMHSSLHSCKEM
ncbi:unnamed protein product [Mytilus coruscus]|uniref:Uncharacterized protein n=1 Tax=Mytilus coruscus TaxID=42192 RepID=A0A6J8CJ02_MYTCO|nr:unnamed protein product [Mytilus coruscus]